MIALAKHSISTQSTSSFLSLTLIGSDLAYGNRYTLDDVIESLNRTGVALKGKPNLSVLIMLWFVWGSDKHIFLCVFQKSKDAFLITYFVSGALTTPSSISTQDILSLNQRMKYVMSKLSCM